MFEERFGDYFKIEDCKHSYLYKIWSRNLNYGVYDSAKKHFVGIREKFGNLFLFGEYHWDTGAPFGTAKPLEEICEYNGDLTESDNNKKLFKFLEEYRNV